MTAIARYYKLPGKNSAELFLLVDENIRPKDSAGAAGNLFKVARARVFSAFETDIPLEHEPIHAVITNFNSMSPRFQKKIFPMCSCPSWLPRNQSTAKRKWNAWPLSSR